MYTLTCEKCHKSYPAKNRLHAGFSDQGFLYCDGDSTVLTFHAYSPEFEDIAKSRELLPWELTEDKQKLVEDRLIPCPCGGRFAFKNPLRCPNCGNPLAQPMIRNIYYYVLDRIVDGEKERVWTK